MSPTAGSTLFSVRQVAIAIAAMASVALLGPVPAHAQFRVGASFGFVRFQGGSEPLPGDTFFLEPYGPLDFRVRSSYRAGDWQFALAGSYARPGIGAAIDFALIMDRSAMKVITVEPTVGRRLLGARDGPSQVWLEAGPSLGIWMISGADTRNRVGGLVAATLRQRIGGAFETVIRADATISPSFFNDSEVAGLLLKSSVSRVGVSVGFDYRP